MYSRRRQGAQDDPGRFAAWGSQEKFKNGTRWVGQVDLGYKITLLEVCNARIFPRQKLGYCCLGTGPLRCFKRLHSQSKDFGLHA